MEEKEKALKLNKKWKLILFCFNILIIIFGFSLIGMNIYGELKYSNSLGVAFYVGIILIIYSSISIFKNNPFRKKISK